ncbi:YveK family protein [Neobacillus terrae]|uniref:YveK family protein n=1 Tax=Neobacillus terrae TaxID=3034837 RepID=UPI00140C31E6|nr:Wzz/FepE/Etk N-terminal domain-containing protein [Neobacillus terrae]NHM29251.1 capsular biosynthesis protein [Neobacillus terrae]
MDNSKQKNKSRDINLKELFLVLKRRFLVIAMVTAILSLAGYLLNQLPEAPLYQSSTRVIIGADAASIKTLQVIVRDSSILDIVIKKLDLSETSEQLANKVSVDSVDGSQVVSISVIDTNAVRASQIADMIAAVFKEEVPKIVGQDYIRILSKAKINPISINPKTNKKTIYGIIGGIVGGIGAAFFLETIDDRVRSKKELEELLDVPVLGRIPKINKRNIKRKVNKIKLDADVRGETIG